VKQAMLRMGQPHKDLAKDRPGYLTWQGLARLIAALEKVDG